MLTTLLMMATTAQATCPDWDASLSARRATGFGSSALNYRWRTVPECDDFAFDHYAVCWREDEVGTSPTPPERPDADGVVCNVASESPMRTQAIDFVGLSNHAFAVRVFACGDADCDEVYGDNGATITGSAAAATTAKERWVFTSVSGYEDTDRAVADNGASAASAIVYPSIFADAGHVGLWYSTMAGGVQNIRYMLSDSTSWGDWNRNSDGFSPPYEVATSPMGGSFGYTTHPWAVPAVDGPLPYVRLFLQVDDDSSPATGDSFSVWSVDSLDENGADFGLTCTGSTCLVDDGVCGHGQLCDWLDASHDGGAATLEIGSSGDALDTYISAAAHGTLLYDYVHDSDGAIDFSAESPSILFTGTADSCYSPPDEVFQAAWDGTSWVLPAERDGSITCPKSAMDDAHDPSVIARPDGSQKVYVQIGTTEYQVCIADVAGWHDCEPIELAFDDGTVYGAVDSTLAACTDNFGAFASAVGGGFRQGAFLHAMGDAGCFGEGSGGILFAQLKN